MWHIIKKDKTLEEFNPDKIITAVSKSADRVGVTLTERNKKDIIHYVKSGIEESELSEIPIKKMHNFVECALDNVNPNVAKSYREYRNYKEDFVHSYDSIYKAAQSIMFLGDDKSNANTDAALVSTKRSLVYQHLNKELYQKFFMRTDELQACRDGYIYIHDMGARRDTFNCFSRNTEFITTDGIASFWDFSDGDEVEVFSHKNIRRKAVVHCYGEQALNKITFKKLYYCNGILRTKKSTVRATENHRWILLDGTETTELKVGDILYKFGNTFKDVNNIHDVWVVDSIKPWNNGIKEEVWCLEVEEDHSFILKDNIPTGNCCLFDVATVLDGGFEMANMWYNEPQSVETLFNVVSDLVPNVAANQYGGITLPEFDKVLEKYCERSYNIYIEEMKELFNILDLETDSIAVHEMLHKPAMDRLYKALLKGFQGLEYKLNTVGSSRGDYPFVAMTFGLSTTHFGKLINKAICEVRKNGQGKAGKKRPVLFPKLIFLYDEDIHGEGKEAEDVFDAAIECSKHAMYPDFLSVDHGYLGEMWKKYGRVVSPMGCRAFLSPWYERGGIHPADENDKPVFVGRHNLGAISMNLPLIYNKAVKECRDFYEVLDHYLEMIRRIHIRTYDYLGELKASCNPVMYCEGGLYGGHLKPNEKIKPILKSCTMSFGITALNELQMLHNGKTIAEDGQFALEVMEHINKRALEFRDEDGKLYAIYGTPAESLATLQATQLKKQLGIIEGVSDREYVTNSFHCSVRENITPIEKQDLEERFWDLFKGGRIQYVRYPVDYNTEAIKTLVRRAMKKGFYEGINMALSYCEHCGYQQLEMDECPECGSTEITKIDRVCGYLGYTRVKGDTRVNEGKKAEIRDRVSM